jgi:hypothetical protein
MAFNRTSYMAGVGCVFMVLSTGFAGGYFMANPTHNAPPNRLQRMASAQDVKPVAQVTPSGKAGIVTEGAAAPAPSAPRSLAPAVQPVSSEPAAPPAAIPVEAKPPEPVGTVTAQQTVGHAITDRGSQANPDKLNTERPNAEKANPEKARTADAKDADKKRAETRKFAEQQRRQREIEVATIAVRRIIRDRDASDRDPPVLIENDQSEAPAPETPRPGLFR